MSSIDVVSLDELLLRKASLRSEQCGIRDEEPAMADTIDDLLTLADPCSLIEHVEAVMAKPRKDPYLFTARRWRGLC